MTDSAEEFLARHADPREAPILADGSVVGVWRIAAFLGRGGSGEVYRVIEEGRAENTAPRRAAALKMLVRDTDASRARFIRETDLLAKMDNPAFPQYIERGEIDGRPYLVMELLEPCTMPSSDAEVADFLLKLCVGVHDLHRMGYVHRDIKPDNILWRDSTAPVLIDLGLVKDITRNSDAEGTSLSLIDGRVVGVGTPGYAAPEQFVGDAISPASDVHALGMLANECFGGKPPSIWGRIIDRATGSIPERRYRDVAAFVRAVRRRHWLRDMVLGATFLVVACGVASVLLLSHIPFSRQTVQNGRRVSPHSPSVSSASPDASMSPANSAEQKTSARPLSADALRRRELERKIEGKMAEMGVYASKASQKMAEAVVESERFFAATDDTGRAASDARLRRLHSQINEYGRLQVAATNGIDALQNELKAMSDSAGQMQVTR